MHAGADLERPSLALGSPAGPPASATTMARSGIPGPGQPHGRAEPPSPPSLRSRQLSPGRPCLEEEPRDSLPEAMLAPEARGAPEGGSRPGTAVGSGLPLPGHQQERASRAAGSPGGAPVARQPSSSRPRPRARRPGSGWRGHLGAGKSSVPGGGRYLVALSHAAGHLQDTWGLPQTQRLGAEPTSSAR